VRIHQVGPHEHDLHEALGALTIGAYLPVHPEFVEDGYAEVLADIAGRVANAVVLAALSDEGDELLGGVTYVPDRSSPLASFDADRAAGIRMLAVDKDARRSGVGEALVRACIARAQTEGRAEVLLHSTPAMATARRLYERLGFRRDESLDLWPEPDFILLGFRLRLKVVMTRTSARSSGP
jgi:ribosomal protein S18 acetylase RimI-like enzyme